MNNHDNLPDSLTVEFVRNDVDMLADIVDVLSRRHPDCNWTLEIGTMWRELTGGEDVTVGEFLSLQLDYPVER